MEKIYSKVDPGVLLHIVFYVTDFTPGRTEIIEEDQYIQCAALRMPKGKTFKPHKHVWKDGPSMVIAQESWVVISGRVKCTFYDMDGTMLCEPVLCAGDASFTLEGGHTYTILDDDTIVFEYKTGPYTGQENDKRFI